jgi:hypothetical protein
MPTRQVESTHDEARHSSTETERATAGAEPNRSLESPSADQMQGANGLPPETNQDDAPNSDQDIDTAGTEADEQSPTRNFFLALTPSLQRG